MGRKTHSQKTRPVFRPSERRIRELQKKANSRRPRRSD